jgi:tripartite-type tricarboxylate transporter receptor subunit TctC
MKSLLSALVLTTAALVGASTAALAQDYPTQPITAVVGFAAGGTTDAANRLVADEAKKILGTEILVQNKPGANTTVAISFIISAKPDGYTIGTSADTGFLRAPHMMKLAFDPIADTTPIVFYARSHNFIVVREDSPFKTFRDLLDYAKANPGKLTYGNTGFGSSLYLGFAGVANEMGLTFGNVVFPGDAQVLLAVLGGHVMAGGLSAGPAVPQVKAGKVRVLAVTDGTQRLDDYPQVPTLSEFSKPENVMPSLGLIVFGPKGLPPHVVRRLEDAFIRAAHSEAFRKWGADNQVYPLKKPLTGDELRQYLVTENRKMGELIDRLGLRGKF